MTLFLVPDGRVLPPEGDSNRWALCVDLMLNQVSPPVILVILGKKALILLEEVLKGGAVLWGHVVR